MIDRGSVRVTQVEAGRARTGPDLTPSETWSNGNLKSAFDLDPTTDPGSDPSVSSEADSDLTASIMIGPDSTVQVSRPPADLTP